MCYVEKVRILGDCHVGIMKDILRSCSLEEQPNNASKASEMVSQLLEVHVAVGRTGIR
jgi:DNA-binding ferritin-like protein